jgi:hypothetical protein
MNKHLSIAREKLILDKDEKIIQALKAMFFPKVQSMKQVPKLRWGKEYRIEEKRKDAELEDGIIALTNRRIFWLHRRGTLKKTFHPAFFIPLKDVVSMNMQGGFAKRINIVSSHGEFQFRFGGMEKFKDVASKLINDTKAKAVPKAIEAPTSLDALKKLKELLDMGAITQQEYEEKKQKILEKL